MNQSKFSLLATLGLGMTAFLALSACEQQTSLRLSGMSAQDAAGGDNVVDNGGGKPGGGYYGGDNKPKIDDDIETDDGDDRDDDDYDSGNYCDDDSDSRIKKTTFYRHLTSPGVEWERKLSLEKNAQNADQCRYDRSLKASGGVAVSKTGIVNLDKCGGFIAARAVYAKNGGACTAKEIMIRSVKVGSVSDYRYLAIGADCVCYYGRELKVNGVLEKIRKRFARSGVCSANFKEWGASAIPVANP